MRLTILLSLLFLVSEFILMLLKRSGKPLGRKKSDKLSVLLFWLVIPLSLSLGFYLAGRWHGFGNQWTQFVPGALLFFPGAFIRWRAILQLKAAFTVDVAIVEGHQLNTTGIYRKIRHPSYLGLLLILAGLGLGTSWWASFLVMFVPVLAVTLYRIGIEEKVLLEAFGQQYADYMLVSKRLIPGVY